jgi:predicted kinase
MKAVIFTGLQASGKTTFFKQYFENEYVHVNLDTLKTRNKERLLLEECFEKDISVSQRRRVTRLLATISSPT